VLSDRQLTRTVGRRSFFRSRRELFDGDSLLCWILFEVVPADTVGEKRRDVVVVRPSRRSCDAAIDLTTFASVNASGEVLRVVGHVPLTDLFDRLDVTIGETLSPLGENALERLAIVPGFVSRFKKVVNSRFEAVTPWISPGISVVHLFGLPYSIDPHKFTVRYCTNAQ